MFQDEYVHTKFGCANFLQNVNLKFGQSLPRARGLLKSARVVLGSTSLVSLHLCFITDLVPALLRDSALRARLRYLPRAWDDEMNDDLDARQHNPQTRTDGITPKSIQGASPIDVGMMSQAVAR